MNRKNASKSSENFQIVSNSHKVAVAASYEFIRDQNN
jgi:hypothetical protein